MSQQHSELPLFKISAPTPFERGGPGLGHAFDRRLDGARLGRQLDDVRNYMLGLPADQWRTLPEIAVAIHHPEASISAQLRHLRKAEFGGYIVNKRRVAQSGLWEYQVKKKGTL